MSCVEKLKLLVLFFLDKRTWNCIEKIENLDFLFGFENLRFCWKIETLIFYLDYKTWDCVEKLELWIFFIDLENFGVYSSNIIIFFSYHHSSWKEIHTSKIILSDCVFILDKAHKCVPVHHRLVWNKLQLLEKWNILLVTKLSVVGVQPRCFSHRYIIKFLWLIKQFNIRSPFIYAINLLLKWTHGI